MDTKLISIHGYEKVRNLCLQAKVSISIKLEIAGYPYIIVAYKVYSSSQLYITIVNCLLQLNFHLIQNAFLYVVCLFTSYLKGTGFMFHISYNMHLGHMSFSFSVYIHYSLICILVEFLL